MTKPVVGLSPSATPQPRTAEPSRPKKWTFSFKYWRQIEHFGLNKATPVWFVSLLEKLVDLSKESIDEFLGDSTKKGAYRYHSIDWTKRNVPINHEDLDWIERDYRDNPEEFPLMQFQISKALGRIVGFWDEHRTFNIVLLDPLHNIQPSRSFSYKVDPCSPLPCQYSTLLNEVSIAKDDGKCTHQQDCPLPAYLRTIPSTLHFHDVVILRISDELNSSARELIEKGKAESIEQILEIGVTFFPVD